MTLVLTAKEGERVYIGDEIVVTAARVKDGQVQLGIDAPRDVIVDREKVRRQRKANTKVTVKRKRSLLGVRRTPS
ncbi:MAG: carbon storage regulator [Pseudomonadota bacterium]